MRRRRLGGGARRCVAAALSLLALLATACAATLSAPPASPSATAQAPPSSVEAAYGQRPSRWGYDPSTWTGQRDPPVEFRPLPAGYRIETYVTGLVQPTSIAFTPDGRLLVAEQPQTVRVARDGQVVWPVLMAS